MQRSWDNVTKLTIDDSIIPFLCTASKRLNLVIAPYKIIERITRSDKTSNQCYKKPLNKMLGTHLVDLVTMDGYHVTMTSAQAVSDQKQSSGLHSAVRSYFTKL